ncbi:MULTISPECIES: heme o synthase [unclassified Hyphomonas]|jgi:protoheme IX farnesyltransferase|uniref:Protoheme IX farnesyltransferase n=2 Tax=root TaxID=1 RepID=A0A160U0F6_9ZZZZ|nr:MULTISPECIES: heme o synthase [unclassified Hyphomonas]MAN89380.1 protoheme IX farnesyltransferase [Hyphomonadaceae bacterium]MAA81033.1 protoheme IX farnesyltransferase [Hyphomonas sp.]MAL48020.1 protoheme IX farnesyltransferase [Hyphomonas sp.]MAX83134.1 protoheme IX farnesyltransferase [Hyphomonas sp.]MBG67026.1 protoheme IX farnesyltransferase [Hyphomonas sp.]|tara:strand:- start:8873 stop:9835 length:963 start_codon:yes stop_codon:yes gene_type:complete
MTEPSATSDMAPKRYATAGDYVQLLKPRIMMLVVFTAIAGLVAAVGVTGVLINPVMAAIATLAIALGSGAAGAINMWYDADIDQIMTRTSTRPIPSGAVPKEEALAMGLIMSGVSVLLMWLASNWLAAALLAFSIFYYGVIYTMWLKRSTPQNIVIGGGAGAFPPVIGWAAVTGNTPVDAWILFAIIFFWTPPHFWALSLLAHGEYEKAGVPMLPVTHGAKATRNQILLYTILLVPIALLPVATGLGGWIYGLVTLALGLVFLAYAVRVWRSKAGDAGASAADMKLARGMFFFSILYLFLVFAALIVEHAAGLHFPVGGA